MILLTTCPLLASSPCSLFTLHPTINSEGGKCGFRQGESDIWRVGVCSGVETAGSNRVLLCFLLYPQLPIELSIQETSPASLITPQIQNMPRTVITKPCSQLVASSLYAISKHHLGPKCSSSIKNLWIMVRFTSGDTKLQRSLLKSVQHVTLTP